MLATATPPKEALCDKTAITLNTTNVNWKDEYYMDFLKTVFRRLRCTNLPVIADYNVAVHSSGFRPLCNSLSRLYLQLICEPFLFYIVGAPFSVSAIAWSCQHWICYVKHRACSSLRAVFTLKRHCLNSGTLCWLQFAGTPGNCTTT